VTRSYVSVSFLLPNFTNVHGVYGKRQDRTTMVQLSFTLRPTVVALTYGAITDCAGEASSESLQAASG